MFDAKSFTEMYGQIRAYAVSHASANDAEHPETKEVAAVLASAGDFSFPGFGNLQPALELCDQFLAGEVDLALLEQVSQRANADADQLHPFVGAFVEQSFATSDRFPFVPNGVAVVIYPSLLSERIRDTIDENGLVSPVVTRACKLRIAEMAAAGTAKRPSPGLV